MIIEKNYDFGKVTQVFEMFGGAINRSFGVVAEKDGELQQYFVRKYSRHASEQDILFEHALMKHLKTNGLHLTPDVYEAKSGATFVTDTEQDKTFFYAVYEFLKGEDVYRWFDDFVPVDVCYNIGVAVAEFHNVSSTFDSGELRKEEEPIYDLMPQFKNIFKDYLNKPFDSIYHQTFKNNFEELMGGIDKILEAVDKDTINKLPLVAVNGDLHQGNMKYDKDGKVVALFDFDWAKIDMRLFELAGVILYLATSWQDNNDGEVYLDKLEAFIKGYQDTLRKLGGFTPLTETEAQLLPWVLQMTCYYNVIYWSAKDHYEVFDTINVYEYDYYLRHGLRVRRFTEMNTEKIIEIAQKS